MTTERVGDEGENSHRSAAISFEETDHAVRPVLRHRILLVVLSLVFPALLVVAYFTGRGAVPRGALYDPDCYVRLVRVRDLYRTGQWHDPVIERANPPYGEASHWSRPLDVLLLGGAVPVGLVTGFEAGLFLWGVVLSPILLAATFLGLIWSSRPLLDKGGPILAALFLPGSAAILACFYAGRPDHHGLLLLLFVLFLGFTLRQMEQPHRVATCVGAAAIAALSAWVSVESALMIAIAISVLGFLWVLRDEDFVVTNLYFSLSLFVLTCASLVIERSWKNWFAVEFDKVSIVHCCLFGLIACFWMVIFLLRDRPAVLRHCVGRLVVLTLGATALAGIVLWLFPGFSRGPLASIDPRLLPIWFRHMSESQPLLSGSPLLWLPLLGSVILCLPFSIVWSMRGDHRAAWIYATISLVVFALFSLQQKRWAAYAQTLALLPLAQLVAKVWMWMDTRFRGNKKALLKGALGAACAYLLAFSGILVGTTPAPGGSHAGTTGKDASLLPLCAHLENSGQWQNRCLRMVTHIYWGGEILYRTRHGVVGMGYHRDARGILDTYAILTAEEDNDALRLIRARGIDTILLSARDSEEAQFYSNVCESTFYRRLSEGHPPPWCREVALPEHLAGSFRLFEVREF